MNKFITSKILTLFIPLLLTAGTATCSDKEKPTPEINKDRDNGKTIVSIENNKCKVSFEYFDGSYKFNKSVLIVRRDCIADEDVELTYIRRLINYLVDTNNGMGEIESVFWGKLSSNESRRLAIAATYSEEWQLAFAKQTGSINKLTLDLINTADIFHDVKKMFSQYDLVLQAESIEKVNLAKPSELHLETQLDESKYYSKVPFQGMLWFSLRKQSQELGSDPN